MTNPPPFRDNRSFEDMWKEATLEDKLLMTLAIVLLVTAVLFGAY